MEKIKCSHQQLKTLFCLQLSLICVFCWLPNTSVCPFKLFGSPTEELRTRLMKLMIFAGSEVLRAEIRVTASRSPEDTLWQGSEIRGCIRQRETCFITENRRIKKIDICKKKATLSEISNLFGVQGKGPIGNQYSIVITLGENHIGGLGRMDCEQQIQS